MTAPTSGISVTDLQPSGVVEGAVRLLCLKAGPIKEKLQLFVEGILIGEVSLHQTVKVGETIDIPVRRFPRVALPTVIRIKRLAKGLASELEVTVETINDVYLLVGKGEVRTETYSVEGGSIVMFLSNLTNGLWEPAVHARVNGNRTRSASIDHIALLDEGGCTVKLRIPLDSTDLHTGGLRVEVFCADRDGAVEVIEFRRVDLNGVSAEIGRLESETRAHYGTQMLRLTSLERELKKMMAALEQRVESFMEYTLALTLDKLTTPAAGGETRTSAGENAHVPSEIKHLMADIRKEVALGVRYFGDATGALGQRLLIKPDSDAYYEGWNYPELDNEQIPFRWMQRKGMVRFPCASHAFGRAIVRVGRCYKGDATSISAYVDGRSARVQCFPLSRSGDFDIHVVPNTHASASDTGGSILTLESPYWGSPSEDGTGQDSRTLSIMVRQIEIYLQE